MLRSLILTQFKMLLRNRQSLYFNLILPVIIMLILGVVTGKSTMGGVRYIDFATPGLIAMTLMQMSVFSVAFVLTQLKDKGILKRLLVTPLRSTEFLVAQLSSQLALSVIQALLLVSVAILVFGFIMQGSFFWLLILSILGASTFLALGFVVAGLAKTGESVPALANLIIFPMLFFGGVFFSIDTLPAWLQSIAQVLPIQYLSHGLREIMLQGHGLGFVWKDILGLAIWLTIFFIIARKVFVFNSRS